MGRAMLFLVSGLVVIAGIIQLANNNRTEVLPQRTSEHFKEQQARNMSSSLLDNAMQNLLANNEWSDEITMSNGSGATGRLTMTRPDPNDDYKILLRSYGTFDGYQAETEVLLQRDPFSKFSYFTNTETLSPPYEHIKIWWWNDDVVTGPFHTNGTLNISGSPTFNGFVSSSNDWVGYTGDENSSNPYIRHGSDTPEFLGGTNFNLIKDKNLPNSKQMDLLRSLATLKFSSSKDIEFYTYIGDGWVKVQDVGCTDVFLCEDNYKLSNYDNGEGTVISVKGEANVKGTVKGRVTLHSTENINIMGDIVYNSDPRVDTTSTDLLGLVSEGNVEVDILAHTENGTSDLSIHGSIMALNTSFTVEDFSSGSPRGALDLLGGIVQDSRGPVGTFSGGSVASGYTKNYVYDNRLEQMIPPSFPRESIYTIEYWREKPVVKLPTQNLLSF